MTQDQVLALVRWVLTLAGPSIIGTGWVSGSLWQQVLAAAPTVVGLIWSLWAHTEAATVTAASKVPGIAPIKVLPTAPASVKAVAADPNVKNVVSAP